MRGDFPAVEDGAIVETRPGTAGVLRSFAARAADAPLAALIIDYGYSQPASGDTVQAVKQHRSPACSRPLARRTLPPMSTSPIWSSARRS